VRRRAEIPVLLVEGRRKDLMRVRDRNLGDRRLMIQGAGIRSIAGIDRFDGLLELDLADLREPELELLEALPELEWLSLDKLRGDVDYRPVQRLTRLRALRISVRSPAEARVVARLDFSRLVALEHLHLWVAEPEAPISLAFTDAMPDLEELFLIDFVVSDEDLARLAAREPPLRRAFLTGRDLAQDQRIRDVLSGSVEHLEIFEQWERRRASRKPRYVEHDDHTAMLVDLASHWDLENNLDAEHTLRGLVAKTHPELYALLDWDSDADELIATATDRKTLNALAQLIDEHAVGR
jgi:hypothetical protein